MPSAPFHIPVSVEAAANELTIRADRSWVPAIAAGAVFLWARKRPAGTITAGLAAYGAWVLAQRMVEAST